MTFLKSDYEQLGKSLETSEEILYAIEQVTGEVFSETKDWDGYGDELENNNAHRIWADGGEELEILANLPTNEAEKDEELFWGVEKFTEFDGEKWKLTGEA